MCCGPTTRSRCVSPLSQPPAAAASCFGTKMIVAIIFLASKDPRHRCDSCSTETAFHQPFEDARRGSVQVDRGAVRRAVINVQGNHINATLNGKLVLSAIDDLHPTGRIGLVADVPTLYQHVQVSTSPAQAERTAGLIAQRERIESKLQADNPKPVLWKRLKPRNSAANRPETCVSATRRGRQTGHPDRSGGASWPERPQ